MIKIIPGVAPEDELPTIELHTFPSPKDPTTRLATAVVAKQEGDRACFTTILNRAEMNDEDALEAVKVYAKKCGADRIYWKESVDDGGEVNH